MHKGQSVIIGAAVLAGAMFHAGVIFPNSSATAKPVTISEAKPGLVTGEGPWRASCKYWSAERLIQPPRQDESDRPKNSRNESRTGVGSQLADSTNSPKTDCEGGDGWGLPESSSEDTDAATSTSTEDLHQPEVRAIIAAVPDPIHSHLALEFDRTIDSLMQAAADRRYLGSNYWFPWKTQHGSGGANGSSETASTEEDRKREQQPGLVILKYSPQRNEENFAWLSYHRVIYLFLVSESPALGMNGIQLRNALRYEAMLRSRYGARLSMSDDDSQLAIIGPSSSGSAASLREGIVNAVFAEGANASEEKSRSGLEARHKTGMRFESASHPKSNDITQVIMAGTTSTLIADAELNSPSTIRAITYYSFGEDTVSEEHRILDSFRDSHSDENHIAILSEDDTVFGEASSRPGVSDMPGGLNATGWPYRPARPDDSAAPYHPIYIRFPREISLLRNAQGEQAGKPTSSTGIPTPYLNLSLKDSSADDTMPQFSTTQTPLSQEAQLMAIAHQLQRARVEYILITASNILDELFLAQFLHRACPDARIVFYNGGDLLVERDVDNARYIGSLSISPYNLTTLSRPFYAGRAFSDSQAEAMYNAASYIFWKGSKGPEARPLNLSGYLRGRRQNAGPALGYGCR